MSNDVEKTSNKGVGKKIPRATFSGSLEIGDTSLPCYVLSEWVPAHYNPATGKWVQGYWRRPKYRNGVIVGYY